MVLEGHFRFGRCKGSNLLYLVEGSFNLSPSVVDHTKESQCAHGHIGGGALLRALLVLRRSKLCKMEAIEENV